MATTPTDGTPSVPVVTDINTPVDQLEVQTATSGPSNPQVKDEIVNPQTNDDVIASFPKTTNEQGVEQVWVDENGFIQGVSPEAQPAQANAPAAPATPTEAPTTTE